ncbi:unnamed protein product [Caenorhabditis nigoni]
MFAIGKNTRNPAPPAKYLVVEVKNYGIGKIKKAKKRKEPESTKPNVEIKETQGKEFVKPKRNQARFVNHFYDPNLIVEKQKQQGMPKNLNFIGLIVIR